MGHIIIAIILAASSASGAPDRSATPVDASCRAAMASYYAALLASARGDADATLRQIIVLRSRWNALTRRAEADVPAWIRTTVDGQSIAVVVDARLESAGRRAVTDVAAAHAELEGIRILLRDARARQGLRTLDDAITDYHDAMERLSSHVGLVNELVLTAADFDGIRDDIRRARAAWADVAVDGELGATRLAANTATTLERLIAAAERADASSTQRGSVELKKEYFDLLGALSRLP